MSHEMLIPLVMRWAHVFAVIFLVGGAVFVHWVLRPALRGDLGEDERARVADQVLKRWRPFVHVSILLLLVSGFYNYLAVTRFLHPDQPLYHMVFGVKFLLALAVFVPAIVLTSGRPRARRLQNSDKLWRSFVLVLAAVVLLAGVMKVLPITAG